MTARQFRFRWLKICIVAMVMIVACELGFYTSNMEDNKGDTHGIYLDPLQYSVTSNLTVVIERRQRDRQLELNKQCRLHQISSKVPRYTTSHMLVVQEYKLVYCFIPKVGCSNWKRILMVLDNLTDSASGLTSEEVHLTRKLKFLSSFGSREQAKILSEYKKFLFVRNPFARVLSAFRNKLENLQNYRNNANFHRFGQNIIKTWRTNASVNERMQGENVTWSEFVKYLIHREERLMFEKDIYFSDHWREMHSICSPCAVKYDFIGHLENVAEEARYLLDKWGAGRKTSYPRAETSRPTNSSGQSTFDAYFSKLSKKDLLELWKVYEMDFVLFGYPTPEFVPL